LGTSWLARFSFASRLCWSALLLLELGWFLQCRWWDLRAYIYRWRLKQSRKRGNGLEAQFSQPEKESKAKGECIWLRLSVLMDLYIHPLYVLVSKIISSILNSSAPIHSLYHHLSTLSTVGPTCHFI
jgi:hypothetical protein